MRNEEEIILREKLLQLCKSAIGFSGITCCGEASPDIDKPWQIQRNGKNIYLELDEALKYLEELTQEN